MGRGVRGAIARYRRRDIELKTPAQLEAMRRAGALVATTLAAVTEAARPGVSTLELDQLAEATIRAGDGVPSFLGYRGFTGSICASVNEQIVHGIPSTSQVLADGDLISVDCGAIVEGWHGDAAVTIAVGDVPSDDLALSAACREAMLAGVAEARPGGKLGDISRAIEEACLEAERRDGVRYGIIEEYGGHGIGSSMHMDPFLANHSDGENAGLRLRPGMALAVEPMLAHGDPETLELPDGWTVVTASGRRAVHWEHTVAITEDGPWLLTVPAEESGAI